MLFIIGVSGPMSYVYRVVLLLDLEKDPNHKQGVRVARAHGLADVRVPAVVMDQMRFQR